MSTAAIIRSQIEAALADRIPSALTPPARTIRPVTLTGIRSVDEVLEGGLPVGTFTELVGGEGSGPTSLALSFLAELTGTGKVCAWIDVSNSLNPESAAAVDLDLSRLLWVRCGAPAGPLSDPSVAKGFVLPEKYLVPPPVKKGLHGGGFDLVDFLLCQNRGDMRGRFGFPREPIGYRLSWFHSHTPLVWFGRLPR